MKEPYWVNAEKDACKLLNSKEIDHSWKRNFKVDKSTEDWDLINSEGIKIEVKSTNILQRFNYNSISPNMPNQVKQIVLKLFHFKNGKIRNYKFVKKINEKWIDITNKLGSLK